LSCDPTAGTLTFMLELGGALGFRVVTVVTRPWGVHFIPWGTLGRTKLQARYVHFLEKETSQPAVNLREFYY